MNHSLQKETEKSPQKKVKINPQAALHRRLIGLKKCFTSSIIGKGKRYSVPSIRAEIVKPSRFPPWPVMLPFTSHSSFFPSSPPRTNGTHPSYISSRMPPHFSPRSRAPTQAHTRTHTLGAQPVQIVSTGVSHSRCLSPTRPHRAELS